ncbi:MAG: Zn-dependent oligopeptidase [Candidatus Eisenbacteria bacterium]|uniref:Zn-dependent oligopeptidase n=1 Tax=Eiseniibacteriota bacterium TaxID=2212470 RepID=A0A538U6C6_UNCEI|nr:MAG: Zn-dependent oligopeptidase [Candidatus Eisenbacteria bacterium]
MARTRKAIERLAAVKGPRTIENTLGPYDEAVTLLDAAGSQAGLMEEVHPDSTLRAVAEGQSQKVSALATELSLDRRVYDALKALDVSHADAETRFYVEHELRDFRLAGVDKDDATRAKITALRDTLVKIGQEFDRNIRGDVRTIQVAGAADLDGLPADFITSHKPGADGKITLDINYPDYVPVMTYAKNDDVRHRLYMEFQNRAYPKNVEVLDRMIAERAALANLLGYPTWADYITVNKMVGNPKNARDFIDKIVAASTASAEHDYQVLLRRKQKDVPDATTVMFWETGYWSEMVRKSDYDFDSQSVRPYFPYDRVKQGVLDVASKMFGVSFTRVKGAPVWDPSVECWEMFEGGKLVGRFYLDMHPRANKYSHAAQFDIRTGVAGKQIPEAALICNLPGGTAGDPGLCEYNDVNTFFHEFGHLLHTLFAGHHRWCGVGGIRTEHDFVEAPSQMLEEWMRDPATLATFAKHYQTGEPIPAAVVKQMNRANDFGKGLQVRRQMVYADLSLSIYDRDPKQVDTNAMMPELVKKYQPFPYVDGTHFQCSFGHLDGYSAVYYTYMWSLVIAKDMFSQFDKNDLLSPVVAKRYRDAVLAPGGSAPAAKLVENFLGRPFNFDAYQAWLNEAN